MEIVDVPTIDISEAVLKHGDYFNADTKWTVFAGKTLNDDTRHHSGGNRINVKALSTIDRILKNAILLDSVVSETNTKKKSPNTAFLHKLYAPITYNGRLYIAKVTVEEYYNDAIKAISQKAYNLSAIKIEPTGGQFRISSSSSRPVIDSINSISDLYDFVKTYDKEFSVGKEVNPCMLEEYTENGVRKTRPKILYHGTNSEAFYIFDSSKSGKRVKLNALGNGYYFSSDKEMAARYGKNVMQVYLDMKNPYPYHMNLRDGSLREQIADEFGLDADKITRDDIQTILRKEGYDGVLAYTSIYAKANEFSTAVVFEPTQIKSATDNIGTFDRSNPDIRYALSEQSEAQAQTQAQAQSISAEEADGVLRGAIKNYSRTSATKQARIAKVYTDAISTGISAQDALSYARVAARTGLDMAFSKHLCAMPDGKYADGYYERSRNRIVINPEATRKHGALLIHELTHAIYYKNGVLTMAKGIGAMSPKRREEIISQYKNAGVKDFLVLADEISAHYAEETLTSGDILKRLCEDEPSLSEKILAFFRGAEKAYSDDAALSSVSRQLYKQYKKLFDKFAAENAGKIEIMQTKKSAARADAGETERRFAFAGEKARTADISRLEEAERMIQDGVDAETVRKETGWFRGLDGKWRFEIDDFDSSLIENPKLEQLEDNGEVYFVGRLADCLDHDELYRSYPSLKGVRVIIQKTETGVQGSYFPNDDDIVMSIKLFERKTKEYGEYAKAKKKRIVEIEATPEYQAYDKFHDMDTNDISDPAEWLKLEHEAMEKFYASEFGKEYYRLMWGGDRGFVGNKTEFGWSDGAKSVLLHEIQHAVQQIEGFATGSNADYWAKKFIDNAFEEKNRIKDVLRNALRKSDSIAKDAIYMYDEYIERLSHKGNISASEFAKAYDRAAREISDENIKKLFFDYAEANEKYYFLKKNINTKSMIAYMNTAGEIEARDTASRAELNAEQRKNTQPEIYRTDAVFVEDAGENAQRDGEKSIDSRGKKVYTKGEKEGVAYERYERTDEFRRIQEESRRLSDEDAQLYHSGGKKLSNDARRSLGGIYARLLSRGNGARFVSRAHLKGKKDSVFNVGEVNPYVFHDIFEINRKYLENGELVDLHDDYSDCKCYITNDGLAGFAIEPDGNLVSVFSLNPSDKKGFLYSVKDFIRQEGATHLDCYLSNKQNLEEIYKKTLGFQTASTMDYNVEYDHDNIAENHGMPRVGFMVATDGEIKSRHFNKNQYDDAVDNMMRYVSEDVAKKLGVERTKGTLSADIRYALPGTAESGGRSDVGKQAKYAKIDAEENTLIGELASENVFGERSAYKVMMSISELKNLSDEAKKAVTDIIFDACNKKTPNSRKKAVRLATNKICDIILDERKKDGKDGKHGLSADELREMLLSIERKINDGYEKRLTARSKMQGRTVSNQKEHIGGERVRSRIAESSADLADRKFYKYHNMTQPKTDQFKHAMSELSKLNWRGAFSATKAREHLGKLYDWYTSDEVKGKFLGYVDNDATGLYNADIEFYLSSLKEIPERKGVNGDNFTKSEYMIIEKVLGYFSHIFKHYGKYNRGGEWVDARTDAHMLIAVAEQARESAGINPFSWVTTSAFGRTFFKPDVVAAALDNYERGFCTQIVEDMRAGAEKAAINEMRLKAGYDDFMKAHKGYDKTLKNERIQYGVEKGTRQTLSLPKDVAIALYMTYKRRQAHRGIVTSGFEYKDVDGKIRVADGAVPLKNKTRLTDAELADIAEGEAKHLWSLFSEADKQYIGVLERGFEEAKKLKIERDMARQGFTNAMDDYYFPISRANAARNVDSMIAEMDRVSSASFNKDTVRGAAQSLHIDGADAIFRRHIHGVCQYNALSPVIDEYNMLWNVDVSGDANAPTSISTTLKNAPVDIGRYFRDLISDVQGVRGSMSVGDKVINFIRGNYAKFQLGANPKTWAKQFTSLVASTSILDFKNVAIGATRVGISSDVDKYCEMAELRRYEETAANAQAVLDTAGKKAKNKLDAFTDKLMSPIGAVDAFVIRRLFGGCQVQIESDGGAKVGTEENKIAAGKLLSKVIYETQQNTLATERSAAMRSKNEIMRSVTMFSADAVAITSKMLRELGECTAIKNELSRGNPTKERRSELQSRLKGAKKRARASTIALMGTAIFGALVDLSFYALYNKLEDEPEEEAKRFVSNTIMGLVGGLPVIRDGISLALEGFEMKNYTYSAANDLISSLGSLVSTIGDMASGADNAVARNKAIKSFAYACGQIFGVPVRNIYNFVHGMINRFAPNAAYEWDTNFYATSYSADFTEALEKGDDSRADFILSLMAEKQTGGELSQSSKKEIMALAGAGEKILPPSLPKTMTIGDESVKLTKKQRDTVRDIYSGANDDINRLTRSAAYRTLSQSARALAIKSIYSAYKEKGKRAISGGERDAQEIACDILGADKIAIAKAIKSSAALVGNAGAKKKLVIARLRSVQMSAGERLLLICALGYKLEGGEIGNLNAEAEKRILRAYVAQKGGLSAEEKKAIMEMIG